MSADAEKTVDRGVKAGGGPAPTGKRVELFGHVTLVQAYDLASYIGCHAIVALRDSPGKSVAVLTSEPRLQSLLEASLATGGLIAFWGHELKCPSAPLGGEWAIDVYGVESVILYGAK